MEKPSSNSCLTVLALAAAIAAQQQPPRPAPPPVARTGSGTEANYPPLVAFDELAVELASKHAPQVDADYVAYVPRSYGAADNRKRRYPCVVWLHPGRSFRWPCAPALDRMLAAGDIPDLIVIVPAACGRNHIWENGSRFGDLERMLLEEILPDVQSRFRVADLARDRAILGARRGAFAAMRLALAHPDLFGTVAVFSMPPLPIEIPNLDRGAWQTMRFFAIQRFGPQDPTDPKAFARRDPLALIDEEKWRALVPLALVARRRPDSPLPARILVTQAKHRGPPMEELARAVSDEMGAHGVDHEFALVDVGPLAERRTAIQRALPRLFRFAAEGFSEPGEPASRARPEKR